MVSNYKRKSNRGSWKEENMQQALKAVTEKRMGWLMASKYFKVPQATLRRRAMNKNKIAVGTKKHLGRHEAALNNEVEKVLVDHMLALEARFFGLTTRDVRILAYEIAEKLKIKHQFNREKKIAGKGWLRSFRLRNPTISLRLPEATSMARAESFNKPQIETFFRNLGKVIDKEKIDKTMIFNMDESALTTVQSVSKIFAQKGKKQVRAITSGERGVHSTVVVCMSTGGNYIPPALIFPRKKFNPTLYDGAPSGTLKLFNESGYMTGELFYKWMEHFIKHVRPTPENKALLLLDGHASHKNLETLTLAKQNSVILFCLPSHCTHRLQPLDVCFFGPLNKYYNAAATHWLKENPGRAITLYQVASLFSEAYTKTATPALALSGFRATGISPLNPEIFPEHMYLPSTVSDVPADMENLNEEHSNLPTTITSELINSQNVNQSNLPECSKSLTLAQESHSSATCSVKPPWPEEPDTLSHKNVKDVLMDISPLPKSVRRSSKRKNNNYQDVLTESPYLASLHEKENVKTAEELRKGKRNVARKCVFKDILKEKSSVSQEEMKKQIIRKSGRNISKKNLYDFNSDQSDIPNAFNVDDDDDCPCLYCNDLYSRSKPHEFWLRCIQCHMWAHAECAGESMKTKTFLCELCKN